MKPATGAVWLCAGWLALAGHARAQAISAQPLPPPAGTGAPPRSPVPPAPKPAPKPAFPPVKPRAAVPVVAAPAAPPKKPAPHPAKAAAKPVGKPGTRPAAKAAAAKPAAKPAVIAPAPAVIAPPVPARPPPDPTKGASTGLPIPRWVSFRSDEVNLRSGPGTQYPIDWVYHRRDYPVQVLREFEVWRLVQEQDGTKGWVHAATLTGRRGFAVQGREQVLRGSPADAADAVAQLMPGVVGHIRKCPGGSAWCEVQAGDYHGWLPRSGIYGVSADEAIE